MSSKDQKAKQLRKKPAKARMGRPPVDVPKENVTVRMGADLLRAVDAWAKENGDLTRSSVISLAVSQLVKKQVS